MVIVQGATFFAATSTHTLTFIFAGDRQRPRADARGALLRRLHRHPPPRDEELQTLRLPLQPPRLRLGILHPHHAGRTALLWLMHAK